MTLSFDVNNMTNTEFGVGRDLNDGQVFRLVPVDGGVQTALQQMALATQEAMNRLTDAPANYDASEKHESKEHLRLPAADPVVKQLRLLHEANNLAFDNNALADPEQIFCYFARMTDEKNRRLTAARRATQFKGVLKSRLVRLITDALTIIQESVFKLDNDFDLLVDSTFVHILRPSGFEFLGNLQEAVLAAVPQNVKLIQQGLPFVDFVPIQDYASKHPRAARYLASIQAQKETTNIDKAALRDLCKRTGVEVKSAKGKIGIEPGHELGFLEVLDRRRYELELVKNSPERYRASSRQKI